MELDNYNQTFDEAIENYAADAEYKLHLFRQQCLKDFIDKLNQRQREWDATYQAILSKCTEESSPKTKPVNRIEALVANNVIIESNVIPNPIGNITNGQKSQNEILTKPIELTSIRKPPNSGDSLLPVDKTSPSTTKQPEAVKKQEPEPDFNDPRFSNLLFVNDYLRRQSLFDQNSALFGEINTNPSLKALRNELNLFIRTQINSISNSDNQHLSTKIHALTSLFRGENVTFQDRRINAAKHPHGQLFAMDLAAQTFVTVGTRLANSVPAIAKSMATVINGIIDNNFPEFKDLIFGHLHQRCPYLVPMYPKQEDFKDSIVKYRIACGYFYDPKTQTLESEDKYISRLRSMVLIFACILAQKYPNLAWSWTASFLSLKPQSVITATVLQAFLQEASKKLSSTYGRQYTKLLAFTKKDYLPMIEAITPNTSERQSLIKLKNLLADDANLISTPSVGSIFGAMKFR